MKIKMLAILFATLLAANCGYGSKYNSGTMMGGGSPIVSQLAPNGAIAGGGGFVLTVNGSGFTSGALVYWNGAPHSAMLISANQLTTTISGSDIENPGTVQVYVRANNLNSNTMNFIVN